METKVITLENFEEIKNRLNVLAENAKTNNCGYSENLAVIGLDAIEKFKTVYAPEAIIRDTPNNLKTDGKTRAELVPFIWVELYADNWEKTSKVIENRVYYSQKLVKFDGVIYSIYTGNKSAGTVQIFRDDYNYYRDYLPYNWEKENPEPQKIGTITDKKMTAWAEYLKQKRAAADQVFNGKQNAAAVLRSKLAALDGSNFDYIQINDKSGQIIKNGLEYHFEITESNTIIQHIEVYYKTPQNIESFLQMIAGNYNK